MNKTVYATLLIFSFSFYSGNAQEINWLTTGAGNESTTFNGVGNNISKIIHHGTDYYTIGFLDGNLIQIDGKGVNKEGGAFLAKFSEIGELVWLSNLPNDDFLVQNTFTINNNGEIIVAANAYISTYLLQYDKDGNQIWSKSIDVGPGINSNVEGLITDSNNNIFVVGSEYDNAFLRKYDNSGNLIWSENASPERSGSFSSKFNDIAIDDQNNLYIIGGFKTYRSPFAFMGDSLTSRLNDSFSEPLPSQDILLMKINPDGQLEWMKSMGGTGEDYGNAITINDTGQIHIAGTVTGNLELEEETVQGNGGLDIMVAKLSVDGNVLWANLEGASGSLAFLGAFDAGRSVFCDDEDNVYLAGSCNAFATFGEPGSELLLNENGDSNAHNGFFAKYDAEGSLEWVHIIDSERKSVVWDIIVHDGMPVIAGSTEAETKIFDQEISLQALGGINFFISQINPNKITEASEIVHKQAFRLYPNPTTGKVYIGEEYLNKIDKLNIYQINGSLVKVIEGLSSAEIDLSTLDDGIYILRIFADESITTYKMIKNASN